MQWQKHKLVMAMVLAGSLQAMAADIDTAVDKGVKRAESAQQSQAKIDAIDSDTRNKERDYRALVKEIQGLETYISQLDRQLAMQQQELADIDSSIEQVTLIERQITPLMLRMIDSIEQFVAADVPFQIDERRQRVVALKDIMGRSDVTVAEKYRKVLDAYQKEMDYGRTIRSYRAPLSIEGTEREVDFLRVGRIALVYQSLDGEHLGVWDQQQKTWQTLGSEYKSKMTQALRIAREQAAPDLIRVPVAAPVDHGQEK